MEGDEARRGTEAALSGGHLCHMCGYQYPNAHPSAKLRRSHRKNCRKASPAVEAPSAAEEDERLEAAVEVGRNAGEGTLLGGGGGKEEGDGANGSASKANVSSSSHGSAQEDGDLVEHKENAEHASPNCTGVEVTSSECGQTGLINCSSNYLEIANEGNGTITNSLPACTNGSQMEEVKQCSETTSLPIGHLAEREDSLDEYQDASPFLHQSDSEDCAAVAHNPTYCTKEINNLNSVSLQPSVTAHELPANVFCKDHLSSEPIVSDLSADSKGGKETLCHLDNRTPGLTDPEVSLKLENPDERSVNVERNNTDNMIDGISGKASSNCEFTGDKASCLQKCSPKISDPDSHSTCFRNMEDFKKDSLDALHIMAEVSPKPEVAGSDNAELETEVNSSTTIMSTENDLKLIQTENTISECTPQNWSIQDNSDVQLCAEDSCKETSSGSIVDYQNNLAVTNADGALNSIAVGISVKGSMLDSSCEARPEPDIVDQFVDTAEEYHSMEKPNGLCNEAVCNKEFNPDVPTKGQVSASQDYVALLMNQVPCSKNPFNLDDTRSDDLFELDTDSYHLETSKVESKHHINSKSLIVDQLTVANQISTDGEKMQTDSASTKMTAVHSIDNVEVKMEAEDTSTEEMTAVHMSIDNVEEKQIEVTGAEMNATPNASSVEKEKQGQAIGAEMNPVQHPDDIEEKKQTEDTGVKEVDAVHRIDCVEKSQAEGTNANGASAVRSLENVGEKNETADASAERTIAECTADNAEHRKQTKNASTKEMNAAHHTDNAEEKNHVRDTSTKETGSVQTTGNNEEKKQPEGTVDEEASKQNGEIAATATRSKSERVHVPLKVLLAEASVETKEKKTSAKERVLSFRRRSSKDDAPGSPKADGQYWDSPARLPHDNADKRPKGRKQPWMPFICCHSVH